VVRAWLDELAGRFEPELVLQQRLAREVPVVGARRLQPYGDAERTIAEALAAEMGAEQALAARLAAAALRVAQETAAARCTEDRALTEPEVAALLDGAVVFARPASERSRQPGRPRRPARRQRTPR
jgi:hypothetical protein